MSSGRVTGSNSRSSRRCAYISRRICCVWGSPGGQCARTLSARRCSSIRSFRAARLGYAFLDTGAIYRAVALEARRRGVDWADGDAVAAVAQGADIAFVPRGDVNGVEVGGRDVTREIRTPEMSDGASRVSAHGP